MPGGVGSASYWRRSQRTIEATDVARIGRNRDFTAGDGVGVSEDVCIQVVSAEMAWPLAVRVVLPGLGPVPAARGAA